jgi:hypothetical protein
MKIVSCFHLILVSTLFMNCVVYGAEETLPLKPVFSGFIDTYWVGSSLNPPNIDRQYTTQAVRNNEFNVNLAYIDAKVETDQVHGRLAVQAGTSVQANYSGEPMIGTNSGPVLARMLQEAYAGYKIAADTWLDAGIMLSHIGLESFISRDNPVYTRSLVADYSPYYETGLRLTHAFDSKWSAQLLVLNGWQTISESNSQKSLGTQVTFQASDHLSFTYNTYFGNEITFRQFHDLIFKWQVNPTWAISGQGDIGFQTQANSNAVNRWSGFTLIAQHDFSKYQAISLRGERYEDGKNVLVATPNNLPFRAWGASIGYDRKLVSQLVWRSELRTLLADHKVFISRSGLKDSETLFVSSLGFSF